MFEATKKETMRDYKQIIELEQTKRFNQLICKFSINTTIQWLNALKSKAIDQKRDNLVKECDELLNKNKKILIEWCEMENDLIISRNRNYDLESKVIIQNEQIKSLNQIIRNMEAHL